MTKRKKTKNSFGARISEVARARLASAVVLALSVTQWRTRRRSRRTLRRAHARREKRALLCSQRPTLGWTRERRRKSARLRRRPTNCLKLLSRVRNRLLRTSLRSRCARSKVMLRVRRRVAAAQTAGLRLRARTKHQMVYRSHGGGERPLRARVSRREGGRAFGRTDFPLHVRSSRSGFQSRSPESTPYI